jgi:hypothetical protein
VSKKSGEKKKKKAQDPEDRWVVTKRRIALSVYLAFLLLAAVGSQGPWWQVINTRSGHPLKPEPDYGNDYRRWVYEATDDPARP